MNEIQKVKLFNFPTFKEWVEKGKEWTQTIGDYTCKVATVAWGCNGNPKNDYKVAISTYSNPTNIYAPKIFSDCISCDVEDTYSLQNWYERATMDANEKWSSYITKIYFEN